MHRSLFEEERKLELPASHRDEVHPRGLSLALELPSRPQGLPRSHRREKMFDHKQRSPGKKMERSRMVAESPTGLPGVATQEERSYYY